MDVSQYKLAITSIGRVFIYRDGGSSGYPALTLVSWPVGHMLDANGGARKMPKLMTKRISKRSYERITTKDLKRITDIALRRLGSVFSHAHVAALYRDRLLLLALCQGGAQHYVDRKNGLKDIDVWAFFREGPSKPFPYRTVWRADLGPSHLGRHPSDRTYTGRRIDIIGRSIPWHQGEPADHAVRAWLNGGSKSAKYIASRPVIGLAPVRYFKKLIWPLAPKKPA